MQQSPTQSLGNEPSRDAGAESTAPTATPAVPDYTRKAQRELYISPQPRLERLRAAWRRWWRRNHGRTTAPLPDAAPVHVLGDERNAIAVPPPLRITARSEKGIGDIFVGREDMMQAVETFFDQDRGKDNPFAMLLTNAPGSGKSALLDEFRFRQAEQGVAVIQLPADAFLSETEFVKELRGTDLWQRSLAEKALIWAATRAGGLLGWYGELRLRLALLFGGAPVAPIPRFRRWYEAAERLAKELERQPPTTVKEALQSIDRACKRGWIIAVDECGEWDRHRENTEITSLLYKIADSTARTSNRLQHGGVLLTGLPHAQKATLAITLTRTQVERLEPLSEREAEALIRTSLERVGAPPAITDRWTATLARDFGMWTQHARRAASVASEMIERTYALRLNAKTREDTWDHRLQLVRQQTGAQIVKLYGTIAGKAAELIGPRALLQLADANHRTNGQIPDAEFQAIIDAGRARGKRTAPRAKEDDAVGRELMAIGLLHQDVVLTPTHRKITWSIPMGNLTSHILASTEDNEPPDDDGDATQPRTSAVVDADSNGVQDSVT